MPANGAATARVSVPQMTCATSRNIRLTPKVSSKRHDGAIGAHEQGTDAGFLQPPSDKADQEGHQHERAPIAGAPSDQRERRIAAQHVEIAMREIDDVEQPKDHGEPQGARAQARRR